MGGIDKKTYLSEVKQTITPGSIWSYTEVGHTHSNNEEIAKLYGINRQNVNRQRKRGISKLKIF